MYTTLFYTNETHYKHYVKVVFVVINTEFIRNKLFGRIFWFYKFPQRYQTSV